MRWSVVSINQTVSGLIPLFLQFACWSILERYSPQIKLPPDHMVALVMFEWSVSPAQNKHSHFTISLVYNEPVAAYSSVPLQTIAVQKQDNENHCYKTDISIHSCLCFVFFVCHFLNLESPAVLENYWVLPWLGLYFFTPVVTKKQKV